MGVNATISLYTIVSNYIYNCRKLLDTVVSIKGSMRIESHLKGLKESIEEIRSAIARGIENKQKTIGFHCSSASVDMVEIYLHSKNLVSPGFQLKHNDFGSESMASEKLNFEFRNKAEVTKLMVEIEKKRNILCYGRQQAREILEEYLEIFNRLKDKMEKMGVKVE